MNALGGGHRLREDTSYRRKRADKQTNGRERDGETTAEVFKKETVDANGERRTDRARCTHAKSYRERESAREAEGCARREEER